MNYQFAYFPVQVPVGIAVGWRQTIAIVRDPREQVFHYTKDGRQESAFAEHATKRRSLKPRYCGSCYSRFVISIIEPQPCREPQSLSFFVLSLSLFVSPAFSLFLGGGMRFIGIYTRARAHIQRGAFHRRENRLSPWRNGKEFLVSIARRAPTGENIGVT